MGTHKRRFTFTDALRIMARPRHAISMAIVVVPLALLQMWLEDHGARVVGGLVFVAAILVCTSLLQRWDNADRQRGHGAGPAIKPDPEPEGPR